MPGMMEQDSGTDDDLPPPSHQHAHSNRTVRGGRISSNGRASQSSQAGYHHARSSPHPQAASAEQQLRKLEQDAYTSVLRAFKAQSEAITWEKEIFICDLRKELRVSDEQHRELLTRVDSDQLIRQIREWRQPEAPSPLAPHLDPAQMMSRKKQKIGHNPQAAMPGGPLIQLPKVLPGAQSSVPSPAPGKRVPVGPRGKKSKAGRHAAGSASKMSPVLSPGRGSGPNSARAAGVSPDLQTDVIGRKVKLLWPEHNKFYEGVITNYDPEQGKHSLVYDMDTPNESFEWVNFQELGPGNLKWVDAPPVSVASKGAQIGGPSSAGRGGAGRGLKRSVHARDAVAPGAGRGRGARGATSSSEKLPTPEVPGRPWRGVSVAAENGLERKGSRQLELAPMEVLVQEVDQLDEEDDLVKLESTKRAVKQYEESVRKALAEVGDSSDEAESDDGGHPPSQSMGQEREERPKEESPNKHAETDEEEDTAGDGRAESEGGAAAGEGGGASDAEDEQRVEEAEEGDEG